MIILLRVGSLYNYKVAEHKHPRISDILGLSSEARPSIKPNKYGRIEFDGVSDWALQKLAMEHGVKATMTRTDMISEIISKAKAHTIRCRCHSRHQRHGKYVG